MNISVSSMPPPQTHSLLQALWLHRRNLMVSVLVIGDSALVGIRTWVILSFNMKNMVIQSMFQYILTLSVLWTKYFVQKLAQPLLLCLFQRVIVNRKNNILASGSVKTKNVCTFTNSKEYVVFSSSRHEVRPINGLFRPHDCIRLVT